MGTTVGSLILGSGDRTKTRIDRPRRTWPVPPRMADRKTNCATTGHHQHSAAVADSIGWIIQTSSCGTMVSLVRHDWPRPGPETIARRPVVRHSHARIANVVTKTFGPSRLTLDVVGDGLLFATDPMERRGVPFCRERSMGFAWIPNLWKPAATPQSLTDIHAGLLDVTDHGTVNWGRSLRLARQIAHRGVRQAVVTVDGDAIESVARRLPHLQALIDQNAIDLNVRVVARLRPSGDLFDRVVRTSTIVGGLNRHYVFLAVAPENRLPIAPIVEQLRQMNLTTILIAPEKCAAMRKRPLEWERIRRSGGLVQVSAASLNPSADRSQRRFAAGLIRSAHCHFIGSEIGDGSHGDPPTTIADGYPMVARLVGETIASQLCHANADDLFHDQPVTRRRAAASRITMASWNRLVKIA